MSKFDTRVNIEESEMYRMGELMAELNELREQEETEKKTCEKTKVSA